MSARQPHELLLAASAPTTMSTREIAELTEKRHDNVKRDTKAMLIELGLDPLKFEGIYLDGLNRQQTEYLLDRELTDTLLTGYSAVLRRKVIARWHELERATTAPALPNFADPAAAARAWADEVEAKQALAGKAAQLEHQVAAQAPAVAGFDLIANADGTMCMRDAAKVLQMRPHKLTDFLLLNEWIYHRVGKPGYIAYQDKLVTGYLRHKLGNYEDPDSGERKVNEQVRITKKGLTKLASMIAAPAARDSPPPGGQQPLI